MPDAVEIGASEERRSGSIRSIRSIRPIRFADRFLPAGLRRPSGEALLRARVTVWSSLIGSAAIFAAILAAEVHPPTGIRAASYGLAVAFLLIPVAMRRGLAPPIAQQILIGLMWLYGSGLALVTGGRDTGAVFVAILIPFFGILFSGIRVGLAWSALMSGTLVAIALAIGAGFEPPVAPDFDSMATFNLWGSIIGIFTTLSLASGYEWLRSDAERKLRREKRRADRLHAEQREIDQRFQVELRALVEERTRALEVSNRELRRAEHLASIGTLAAGVAHEINNPIGAIVISADFALASAEGPEREAIWRSALEESRAQAQRCARIVKALLRFSAGSSAEKGTHDLNAIVDQALAGMRGGLGPSELSRVETRLTGAPLEIVADPLAIEQVVVNLVRNALEASAEASGVVRIATDPSEDGPCFAVEDDGPGIREVDLPRIFDPFFSTRDRSGGTGLGLSIVHGIVTDHGGTIEVDTQLGKGTCFRVRFPACAPVPPPLS
ncbi:MAG: ATP-binding protein [Myxococcota bacterium]